MGEFLSTPIKEKESEDGENDFVSNCLINHIASLWRMWNARMA